MKTIIAISLAILASLIPISNAKSEVLVQIGQMRTSETNLDTLRLSLVAENRIIYSIYGATDKLELFKNEGASIGEMYEIKDNISLFGTTIGYNQELLSSDNWTVSLKPAISYEWERRRRDTSYVRAVINGKKISVAERSYINSDRPVGLISIDATYKQTLFSVSYDTEERVTLTIGMLL